MSCTRIWLVGQKSFGTAVFRDIGHRLGAGRVVGITAPLGDNLTDTARERGLAWSREVRAEWIRDHTVDVIVNAHGHAFIGREARESAKYGAIGYHPSLLPRHRGRSAVEWTIAMGDPIAGGTVYQLDDGYDTGPIVKQDWCHVDPEWTASDLWRERLFPMGVELLTQVLAGMSWGPGRQPGRWPITSSEPQDERLATYEAPWDPDVPSLYQAGRSRFRANMGAAKRAR